MLHEVLGWEGNLKIIKCSNGYESSGRNRDAGGESTQSLDTVEGQDTPLRPHGKHNDNFVDAPHSPTPSRWYDIANVETGEMLATPRSPGPQQPQLRSKDSAEILKDLEWFGSLPGQNNPWLYYPVKGVDLNEDSQANDNISEYTNTTLPFQDHCVIQFIMTMLAAIVLHQVHSRPLQCIERFFVCVW